jgi:hypothetical protein
VLSSTDALQRLLNDPAELRRQTIANVARVDPDLARAMRGESARPAAGSAPDRTQEQMRQADALRDMRARWQAEDGVGEDE